LRRPVDSSPRRGDAPLALIVADPILARLTALCLRHCGCRARAAKTPAIAARDVAAATLLVVDVDLSRGAAMRLVRPRRGDERPATIALIPPSHRWSSFDAFARGADQVVAVPFTPDEFAVRTFALLWRLGVPTNLTHAGPLNGLALNIDETVRIADQTVRLTPAQNSILYVLAANAGRRVSVGDIRRTSWGFDVRADNAAVSRRVQALGRLLIRESGPRVEAHDGSFSLKP
jgi:DNA-binding response OmpR family regulator